MSRSRHHAKARRSVKCAPDFPAASDTVYRTHDWGHTERGRRRHRGFWSRVLGRQRRAWDRMLISEQGNPE